MGPEVLLPGLPIFVAFEELNLARPLLVVSVVLPPAAVHVILQENFALGWISDHEADRVDDVMCSRSRHVQAPRAPPPQPQRRPAGHEETVVVVAPLNLRPAHSRLATVQVRPGHRDVAGIWIDLSGPAWRRARLDDVAPGHARLARHLAPRGDELERPLGRGPPLLIA